MSVQAMGMRPVRQAWTADRVVAEIRARQSANLPLNSNAVVADDERLAGAARRYFGSWDAALEAAGIDPQAVKRPRSNVAPPGTWSPEKVLADAQARLDAGRPMNAAAVRADDSRLYGAAVHQLGSWGAVCEALGLDYDGVRRHREWTAERVAERIGELAANGADLSIRTAEAFDSGLVAAAALRYGSWEAACAAAGVDGGRRTTEWTRERVLEALQQGATTQSAGAAGLRKAAIRHFGSWEAAQAAALPPQPVTSHLRQVRERLALSQAQVGALVGRTGQWVGLVERGATVPDLPMALALAAALGVAVEDLFVRA